MRCRTALQVFGLTCAAALAIALLSVFGTFFGTALGSFSSLHFVFVLREASSPAAAAAQPGSAGLPAQAPPSGQASPSGQAGQRTAHGPPSSTTGPAVGQLTTHGPPSSTAGPAAGTSPPVQDAGSPFGRASCSAPPHAQLEPFRYSGRGACTLPRSLHIASPRNRTGWMLELLRGPAFAMVRWSDGEWLAAGRHLPQDANGKVPPALQNMLLASLEDPKQVKDAHLWHAANVNWLCKEHPGSLLHSADRIMQRIPEQQRVCFVDHFGLLEVLPFPAAFRAIVAEVSGKCILVGPPHFRKLMSGNNFLHCRAFISLPCCNLAVTQLDTILQQIKQAAQKLPPGRGHIFVSAGLVSKVIVPRLFSLLRHKHTVVDSGSSLDVFCGVYSRDYNGRDRLKTWCERYPDYLPQCHHTSWR